MYLTLMHTLNTKGWGAVNADKDLKAKFDSYVKSFGFSTVAARAKFLEYDEEKDAKKKDDILKEICQKLMSDKFEHNKPAHLKKIK